MELIIMSSMMCSKWDNNLINEVKKGSQLIVGSSFTKTLTNTETGENALLVPFNPVMREKMKNIVPKKVWDTKVLIAKEKQELWV